VRVHSAGNFYLELGAIMMDKSITPDSSSMLDPLLLDLIEWIARSPRPYHDVIEAWRTSCPRLTVWEDAVDRQFVEREGNNLNSTIIKVTKQGRAFLKSYGRGVCKS
jgi:hypothetical protein